jgi:hypothetical protein
VGLGFKPPTLGIKENTWWGWDLQTFFCYEGGRNKTIPCCHHCVIVSVNSNLCDAQWRILDQLHGENYACQDYIDREIIWHAQNDHSDDRLLVTFYTAKGKNTPTWKYMVGARKKQCFRIEGRKNKFFFLISEMECRQIRNPKNIISEALFAENLRN